jgi:hypothetical protein
MEEQLSNKIFDLKEKLTDGEFKDLMDTLQGVYKEKKETEYVMYEVDYIINQVEMKATRISTSFKKLKAIIKLSCKEDFSYGMGEIETEKHFLERVQRNDGIISTNNHWTHPTLRNFQPNVNGYTNCEICNDECCEECGECRNNTCDFTSCVEHNNIVVINYKKIN